MTMHKKALLPGNDIDYRNQEKKKVKESLALRIVKMHD